MPSYKRPKRNFTAGELSPIMSARVDNARYKNGCHRLRNMTVLPQGPATRRTGLQFIEDMTPLLDGNIPDEPPRMLTFEFNEEEAYAMVFYYYYDSVAEEWVTRFIVGYGEGLVADSVDPDQPFVYEIDGVFDIWGFSYAQSGDVLYITQSDRTVLLVRRVNRNEWDVVEMGFLNDNPPPDWSDINGWPELVSFYEQRLVFGANKTRPQTLWFSGSGDFTDFDNLTSQTLPSDPFVITLDSGKLNKIRWLASSRNLLAGTVGAEWSIFGGNYEPITYTNPRAVRHTNNGSEKIETLMVGPVTLFVERYGTNVSQLVYDYNSDSYDVVDLSVLAPHLTEEYYVSGWSFQQKPGGVVWCCRSDGDAIALTLKREHKVTGWHRHDTQGKFLTLTSVPGERQDDIWCVVDRGVLDEPKWYIEKMRPAFKGTDTDSIHFCDSHVVFEYDEPQYIIDNLDHLEGMQVVGLADGSVVPETVVIGGQITLATPACKVVIGLSYVSELQPTLLDVEMSDGTVGGREHRITQLKVLLHNSIGFEYGVIDSEGIEEVEEEPFRTPLDTVGAPVPLFSGWKDVDLNMDYDDFYKVFIRQRQPLPLTVVGITDVGEAYE